MQVTIIMKNISTCAIALLASFISMAHASEPEAARLGIVVNGVLDAIYGECCLEHTKEEKLAQVRAAIETEYDLSVIIRRAIGRNWKRMKPTEQEQVLELMKQLVVKAYFESMDGKNRPDVELGDVVNLSDKRLEIPTTAKLDEHTINVLYRLGKMRSGWQIYDIVAEDISLVKNYRQQINDHFRKGNGAELITKLEKLLTKDDLDEEIKL